MNNIILNHNKAFQWYSDEGIHVKGSAFSDDMLLHEDTLAKYFRKIEDEDDFKKRLIHLNGIFSVIIDRNNTVFAAVDRLRNYPILYHYHFENQRLTISDNFNVFLNLPGPKKSMNEQAKEVMCTTGYVLGKSTLLNDVYQLRSSEYLVFRNQNLHTGFYYKVHPHQTTSSNEISLKQEFLEVLEDVRKRLFRITQNRPVALPLSGGFDSRLIGWLLKQNKHNQVVCFTFGDKKHPEIHKSEIIAKRLGYPWLFIDYSPYIQEEYFKTDLFNEYVDFTGNAISFPYIQEYFAARYLKEIRQLPENTIFIPGHSGDMLGGSHFFPDMKHFSSLKDFSKKIIRTNCRQIPLDKKKQSFIRNVIESNSNPAVTGFSHLMHDDWNITERQSKQIVNSSKIWNFFGYEYILPLWDNQMIDFFTALPFSQRIYKKLYNATLEELFSLNGLLLEDESATAFAKTKKQSYIKKRLKETLPFLSKLQSAPYSFDFFYFNELLQPLSDGLPPFQYSEGNAILTHWYIEKMNRLYCNS